MMPNKRNPDPAELVRGRAARTIGALTTVLGLLKGLPLGYQRDLQEDKPPLFEAVATWEASLAVLAGLIRTVAIDRDAMAAAAAEGYSTATTLADALVRRGVPFRAAHHVVGALVARAEATRTPTLAGMPPAELETLLASSDDAAARRLAVEPGIGAELLAAATVEASLAAADVTGGTAPARVAAAIAAARERLETERTAGS
jgi:argininosuccinate lyase